MISSCPDPIAPQQRVEELTSRLGRAEEEIRSLSAEILERYEEAIRWAQQSLQRRPDWPITYLVLAASYAQLDRIDEAQAAVQELLRLNPDFSLAGFQKYCK